MEETRQYSPVRCACAAARAAAAALACLLSCAAAQAIELKPHKDRLFAYPSILAESMGGRYLVIDYDERRDIDRRDEIPERRVHGQYVSLKVRRMQTEVSNGTFAWFAVGNWTKPAIITLYVHGKGGNRNQGVNDFSFGGNFNRIKNLMAENGGLYLSPDVTGFDVQGARNIAEILRHYHRLAPLAPVIVACGSMGAMICYHLAADREMTPIIRGYLLLGAPPDDSIFRSPAFQARTPVFIGHGSADRVYPIDSVEKFFRKFEKRSPGYPVRLHRFETGTHGTPIRMTDWRLVLNWIVRNRS